ncbi:MAG: Holliday junction branch migration protein RuvA [Anaerolineae bacterium]|nr:Holliday junction branch migration protein RuvA [Anaerolineae bacterium]
MIASLRGTVSHLGKTDLIVEVGGVGVRVAVPKTVLENPGGVGRTIFLHTQLLVRENELALFGFASEEDLALFLVLLDVNGVGPKVALAILSTLSPELLKNAILREEASVLQRVPGIGKKTAERIMFHLRDKLDLHAAASPVPFLTDADGELIDLLTSLGFSIVEAQSVLQKLPREVTAIDERVQLALQYLDRG